jgi:hypothetical protein
MIKRSPKTARWNWLRTIKRKMRTSACRKNCQDRRPEFPIKIALNFNWLLEKRSIRSATNLTKIKWKKSPQDLLKRKFLESLSSWEMMRLILWLNLALACSATSRSSDNSRGLFACLPCLLFQWWRSTITLVVWNILQRTSLLCTNILLETSVSLKHKWSVKLSGHLFTWWMVKAAP